MPGLGLDSARTSQGSHRPEILQQLTLYTQNVANHHKLGPKHQKLLLTFSEIVVDTPPAQWRTYLHMHAASLRSAQEVEQIRTQVDALKQHVDQVAERAHEHFTLDTQQENEICVVCKATMFEPTRTDFDIAESARNTLKDATKYPILSDAFTSKAGRAAVLSYARESSNYARNHYREILRDSIYNGKHRCSLTTCTRRAASRLTESNEITTDHIIRVAILRRFCRENAELLNRSDSSFAVGHGKRPRHGEGFWESFGEFLKTRNKDWGTDIHSEGWAQHIDECIMQERMEFPEDSIPLLPQRMSHPPEMQIDNNANPFTAEQLHGLTFKAPFTSTYGMNTSANNPSPLTTHSTNLDSPRSPSGTRASSRSSRFSASSASPAPRASPSPLSPCSLSSLHAAQLEESPPPSSALFSAATALPSTSPSESMPYSHPFGETRSMNQPASTGSHQSNDRARRHPNMMHPSSAAPRHGLTGLMSMMPTNFGSSSQSTAESPLAGSGRLSSLTIPPPATYRTPSTTGSAGSHRSDVFPRDPAHSTDGQAAPWLRDARYP